MKKNCSGVLEDTLANICERVFFVKLQTPVFLKNDLAIGVSKLEVLLAHMYVNWKNFFPKLKFNLVYRRNMGGHARHSSLGSSMRFRFYSFSCLKIFRNTKRLQDE